MKAESTVRPQRLFEIERSGERARVIFFDNVEEFYVRNEDDTESLRYRYDTFNIEVLDRSNLEESVLTNLEEWKNAAIEKENEVPKETDKEKIARLEKENKQLGVDLSEREINEIVFGIQLSDLEIQLLELKGGN